MWHLDTETKGTGAHVAPLERARGGERRELSTHAFKRPPRPERAPDPPAPRRFKVVDVRSARVLAEDVGAREAIERLEGLSSVLDARVFVRARSGRWRLLTLAEQRALWGFRGRASERGDAGARGTAATPGGGERAVGNTREAPEARRDGVRAAAARGARGS